MDWMPPFYMAGARTKKHFSAPSSSSEDSFSVASEGNSRSRGLRAAGGSNYKLTAGCAVASCGGRRETQDCGGQSASPPKKEKLTLFLQFCAILSECAAVTSMLRVWHQRHQHSSFQPCRRHPLSLFPLHGRSITLAICERTRLRRSSSTYGYKYRRRNYTTPCQRFSPLPFAAREEILLPPWQIVQYICNISK